MSSCPFVPFISSDSQLPQEKEQHFENILLIFFFLSNFSLGVGDVCLQSKVPRDFFSSSHGINDMNGQGASSSINKPQTMSVVLFSYEELMSSGNLSWGI